MAGRQWPLSAAVAALMLLTACSGGAEMSAESKVDESGPELSPPPTWVRQSQVLNAPKVRVLQPIDGSVVAETFTLQVAFEGIRPAAAGRVRHGEGHWNVLVDRPCIAAGQPIPVAEDGVTVVGNGTLVDDLSLEPGVHELCIQVADGYHIATNIRDFVTVTVGQDGMVPPDL